MHFQRDIIRKKKNIRVLSAEAAAALADRAGKRDRSVYTNRKRNSPTPQRRYPNRTKQMKLKDPGQTYTLKEGANSKDNTKVNVSFHKFTKFDSDEYEDSEPTFIASLEESEAKQSADDNDCIITDEPLPPVIDLSIDESAECQEGPSKMIELILCNDDEPESSEMFKEYVLEISNELEDQEFQQPLKINFTTFTGAEDDVSQSIDLTDEQNNKDVDGYGMKTIDLTSEQISEEETNVDVNYSTTEAVIEQIKQKLDTRYPSTVKSISWNVKTKQFEVSIRKKNGFKTDNTFHQYLREVVNQEIQMKKLINEPAEPTRKSKYFSKVKVTSNGPVTEAVILNKDYALKQQEMMKGLKKPMTDHLVNPFNGNLSPRSVTPPPPQNLQLTSETEIVRNFNASQILTKAELYLGVTVETFQRIENLLKNRFKNQSVLILLLRKIKLNEPFAILSDVLCSNTEDCIKIYKEILVTASRTLQGFLRWPTNSRDSLAIMDIFEIEIEKPNSLVEQSASFCRQRQRFIVKFIICCTSTGYIFHVSMPFFSIQRTILLSSFASIPKCSSVVVNPNLLNFGKEISPERTASLFDCNRFVERNRIQRVFDRLRRFSLLRSNSDLKNVDMLQQTLSVVASLCNLEEEVEI